jgi:hypothetical protein
MAVVCGGRSPTGGKVLGSGTMDGIILNPLVRLQDVAVAQSSTCSDARMWPARHDGGEGGAEQELVLGDLLALFGREVGGS